MAEQNKEQKQQQAQSQYVFDRQTASTQKLYYDRPQYQLAENQQTYKVPYVDQYYKSQNLAGSKVLTQSWIERVPQERSIIEYVPQQRIEYVPVEKKVEDYYEVQHEIEQVPITRLEKYTDYIPVEKYAEKVEYVPIERSFVRNQSALGGYRSFQYPITTTTATTQPVITSTVQQPVTANANVVTTGIPNYSYVQGSYYPGAYSGLRSSTLKYAPNYSVPYSTVPYSSYVGYSRYPSYYYDRPYYQSYRPGYYGQSGLYYSGLQDRYPYQKYL